MTATKGLGITGNGAGVTTPLDHKLAQSGLIAKTGAGTNLIRPGLFYDGVSNIVSGAANMSYNVAPFTAALTRGGTAGTVLLANDGTVNVATAAAPASNSRIDVVYVWQREFSLDGVDSNPVIGVIQGTAAASPVAPSLAAFPGALELARITVPAGVTATNTGTTITQAAPFTAAAGGTIAFRTTTERDASTLTAGTRGFVIGSTATYQYNGTSWITQFEDTGWTSVTPSANWGVTAAVQYRRVSGRVSLRGIISQDSAGANIITLPAGFRPDSSYVFPLANSANAGARITVSSAGLVSVTASLANGTFVYLHNISFIAEA